MNLKGARVLLTGGTGFIGSALAASLHAAKADVRLLIRPSSRGELLGRLWKKLPTLVGDLDDPAALAEAVHAADPEYVFHLAKPRDGATFEREVRRTAALASVLAAHAPNLKRWIRTAHAASDRHGRGADAELARSLASHHRLDVVTLELFLVYGPGQRAGGFPRGLAEAALSGRPIQATSESKDLLYVADAVRAYELAAIAPGAAGAWIPVGGGRLVPGKEVAQAAARAAGRPFSDVVPSDEPPRDGGHPADLDPAREKLYWTPLTSVDAGMRQLVQWLGESSGKRRG